MQPEDRAMLIEQGKESTGGTHRLWCKGDWKDFPKFKVPVEALALNIDNKRFAAEKNLVEDKLQRPLDPPNNENDEESVVSILCDHSIEVDLATGTAYGQQSKDFEALRDDWLERKQAEPLWIRPDGTVHNGNRRLAMIKRLQSLGQTHDWVEAIILSRDEIDDKELFRMEQREQLAENFKKRYADINALLVLKEAAELEGVDWSDRKSLENAAHKLKHYAGRDDAGYALVQLRAVRAIDAYLDFIDSPGTYHLVRRQVEIFREVGKCMALSDNGEYPEEEAAELVEAAFAFVQSGRKYKELRQLRAMFTEDREQFENLYASIREAEDQAGWAPDEDQAGTVAPDMDVLTAPEDEDEEDEPAAISQAGYPREPVGEVIDGALDEFGSRGLEVVTQLQQAVSRLEKVDLAALQGALGGDRAEKVREMVGKVLDWSDVARTNL